MKKEKLIEQPITTSLLTLAWPIILSNLMQTTYNIVDTIWVGKLGADAVAAVSLGFPIIFLMMSLALGFTIAGTSLIAQHKGAQEQAKVNKYTGQTLVVVTIVSIVFSVVGFIFNEQILRILGAEGRVLRLGTDFLNMLFIGLTPMFIYFVFTSVLRGLGDSKTPMKLMFISTVINIILDPVLIFGWGPFPKLEVLGAALATTLARVLVAIIGVKILFSGDYGVKLQLADLWPKWGAIKKLVAVGVPASLEQSTNAVGMLLMTGTVATFGTSAVAAYGIGNRVLSLVFMPALGFSAATTTLVGQHLGADNQEKAEQTVLISTLLDFLILTGIAILVFGLAPYIVQLFNDNAQVLNLGTSYLQIIAFSFGFMGTLRVVNGGFKGAGDTIPAMVFSALSLCVLRVPLANFLAHYLEMGTRGLWWGVFIANLLGAILAFIWFKRGVWKKKVIVNPANNYG
ncbi:putative efflux protein, MATE family [Halobacteroides halobius DSM 5150]|uniref:Probable multidrug resistance protein NorM n=1 Tax=Halobacteroides halobius (strain ATCC 35273 / DSM 5150 / MD-1) TaxID=748449 RepID=L0K8N6_HALHC|nr:MATE family efflux transporter [Halobacteroides halobius]AGB40900.1 putative efflux protein, MATE family [Halobacteroides halobius DSM 5150]